MKQTDIDLKTAFRWDHCFFASATRVNINTLSGIVEVNEMFFPESFKWKRYIPYRKARKRRRGGDKRNERNPCS
ncbi:MAG: hypothetical protein ACTS73_08640 [Arsenophonus sp. NEOnobi-MAG3]